jgi:hypothetical protein
MELDAQTVSTAVLLGLIALGLIYRAIFDPEKGSSSFDLDGGDGGDGGD